MLLEQRDLGYLLDMVECCQDIEQFTTGISFDDFAQDKMRRFATERQLQTIGEAANHVSADARVQIPGVEWEKIVGLRNKLAHDYGEILAQRVWLIAVDYVPRLRRSLLGVNEVSEAASSRQE